MMAVIIGGLIVIWLGLTMAAAMLRWLGIELHYLARIIAPLLLAAMETAMFLLAIPGTERLPLAWHWPMTGGLIAAAWLVNGAVSGLYWFQQRPPQNEAVSE
ncbi:MAG: hypothetical protein MI751_15975 [Pseudomonadales bacterium]|uniref:hypothetical protein n=1 Tax=Alcanivorax sp. MD8A TaxID=1177157 RepID=UPI000CBC0608|nr:hypothetical protein [Alcanivorax sp. MD8A]MCG8439582.1 hypothetical protein [Pseudomonadales bacterium]PNE02039.1 hypothetical protein A15D_02357 [Alcanivorax sp. MD8A]